LAIIEVSSANAPVPSVPLLGVHCSQTRTSLVLSLSLLLSARYWHPWKPFFLADAWVFGAIDPHSGSAPLMEIGRCIGSLVASGWKPQRTIKLFSWDGEEYGLLGSTTNALALSQEEAARVVAYYNVRSLCPSTHPALHCH
jgi:Zn-dependent M28 family amino/carboxypeptidase